MIVKFFGNLIFRICTSFATRLCVAGGVLSEFNDGNKVGFCAKSWLHWKTCVGAKILAFKMHQTALARHTFFQFRQRARRLFNLHKNRFDPPWEPVPCLRWTCLRLDHPALRKVKPSTPLIQLPVLHIHQVCRIATKDDVKVEASLIPSKSQSEADTYGRHEHQP